MYNLFKINTNIPISALYDGLDLMFDQQHSAYTKSKAWLSQIIDMAATATSFTHYNDIFGSTIAVQPASIIKLINTTNALYPYIERVAKVYQDHSLNEIVLKCQTALPYIAYDYLSTVVQNSRSRMPLTEAELAAVMDVIRDFNIIFEKEVANILDFESVA